MKIEFAKTRHPELILIDVQMSKMDGLEAIRRIRQDAQIQDIPIIALMARAMMGDQKSCLAAGRSISQQACQIQAAQRGSATVA